MSSITSSEAAKAIVRRNTEEVQRRRIMDLGGADVAAVVRSYNWDSLPEARCGTHLRPK